LVNLLLLTSDLWLMAYWTMNTGLWSRTISTIVYHAYVVCLENAKDTTLDALSRIILKPAAHDAYFPAGLLAFSKLLDILLSVWCNFSNLLNASNSAEKQASCAAGFIHRIAHIPVFLYFSGYDWFARSVPISVPWDTDLRGWFSYALCIMQKSVLKPLRNWSITLEFEENYRLWLVNFSRLKVYYTYCRLGLMDSSPKLTESSHCRLGLKLRNQDGRDGFFPSPLRLA